MTVEQPWHSDWQLTTLIRDLSSAVTCHREDFGSGHTRNSETGSTGSVAMWTTFSFGSFQLTLNYKIRISILPYKNVVRIRSNIYNIYQELRNYSQYMTVMFSLKNKLVIVSSSAVPIIIIVYIIVFPELPISVPSMGKMILISLSFHIAEPHEITCIQV